MRDFEKLGVFYMGRRYDPAAKQGTDDLVLYDSKDLVTHALCVGMTGSGKTGLCIDLIEEAAIDGVPAIVIDPKGDLSNLLLTFPQLRPEDFAPWVNEDDARRAGKSTDEYAAAEAAKWTKGLADWSEDGARIARLRDAAEFTIYTPGSTAGVPVSVLKSFDAPLMDDPELLQQRIETSASGLLSMVGIDADPVKSREHLLLSSILQDAWGRGENLDLATIVQRIQQPPMARVGVIDTDSFFPPKERFAFAMAVNGLLASPGFATWLSGDPLDAGAFLRTPAGKPRVSIFSVAHLDDRQRMFFVSLLLNAVISWMRSQQGTTSLRAILYMDEIFGFFPPIANPPSKPPLLTLLKQGRAFGVGVVLATQNPVDLDYKGLSNIGTWWLGRLQTERDKARVLDGLEGASEGAAFDRAEVDRLLSALGSRVFLMRNVHENGLEVFQSRWSLSYLRGPLGRDEIKKLMAQRAPSAAAAPRVEPAVAAASKAVEGPAAAPAPARAARPMLPPDVPQFFVPASGPVTYEPMLYGAIDLRFADQKLGIDIADSKAYVTAITDAAVAADWASATVSDLSADALTREPAAGARFTEPPAAAARAKNYDAWSKQLVAWAAANESLQLFVSRASGERSNPGESEREFRARLQQAAREQRDAGVDALRKKYAAQQAALDDQLRRAKQAVERESTQATTQKLQTAISFGATLVTALLGRKTFTQSTIGRATTAARGLGRSVKESEDIRRAQETVDALGAKQQQLEAALQADTAALQSATDPLTEPLDRVTVKPKKGNVTVKLCALVWVGR